VARLNAIKVKGKKVKARLLGDLGD
jgi:hypothetical protein